MNVHIDDASHYIKENEIIINDVMMTSLVITGSYLRCILERFPSEEKEKGKEKLEEDK